MQHSGSYVLLKVGVVYLFTFLLSFYFYFFVLFYFRKDCLTGQGDIVTDPALLYFIPSLSLLISFFSSSGVFLLNRNIYLTLTGIRYTNIYEYKFTYFSGDLSYRLLIRQLFYISKCYRDHKTFTKNNLDNQCPLQHHFHSFYDTILISFKSHFILCDNL